MKAFALVITMFFIAGSIYAEPEINNLRAFKTLVPDYSKTSGGSQPALSLDGKTLAFTTGTWDIWILHADNLMTDKAEPWKLNIEPERGAIGAGNSSSSRNIDWSPDGKRLVFSCGDSYLYLAENFDFGAKTAAVRIIARPKLYDEDKMARDIDAPRWSPDGKKIAFVRTRWSNASVLCVLDLETGVETELDQRACDGYKSYIWEQPWSPNSRKLAYATCDPEPGSDGGVTINYTGIDVISIDGKDHRRVVEGKTYTPSWNPTSDRIAYSILRNYTVKEPDISFTSYYFTIMTTDSRGSTPKGLYQHNPPTNEQIAAQSPQKQSAMERMFEYEYGSKLAPEQQKRLHSGKMTAQEMKNISAIYTAREIDADFAKLIEQRISSAKGKEISIWKDPVISKAISNLPKEKQTLFLTGASRWQMGVMMTTAHPGLDSQPVWSQDGTKLAFIRQDIWKDHETLMMLDIKSKRLIPLFDAHEITNISWTIDSKLLLQATRLTGRQQNGEHIENVPSYPEILLLEPNPVD